MRASRSRVKRTAGALVAGFVGMVAAVMLTAAPGGAQTGLTSGDAVATDGSVASGTAFATNDSTASGDAIAVDGSTASGCAKASDDSTASGGAVAVDNSTASGGACPAAVVTPVATTVVAPTVVTPATTVPTAITVAPPTTTAPVASTPVLARTGSSVIAIAATGIFVALAGAMLLGYASKRWPVAFYGW
ncbi:MAG: hypothetical protein QOG43_3576 [Actinomycetota bacterium]|nr:hypothetical protein [Actinomycetota bacterium]